jgi:hypothetical protein
MGQPSRGTLKLKAIPVGKNRIINGAFIVSQRGTITNTDGGWLYGPDRWRSYLLGTGGAAQVSVVRTVANGASLNWNKVAITTVPTATLNGSNMVIPFSQLIEAINVYDMAGQPAALSFKFQASTVGAYAVTIIIQDGSGTVLGQYTTTIQYTTAGAVAAYQIVTPPIPYNSIIASAMSGAHVVIGAVNSGLYQATTLNAWYYAGTYSGYSVAGVVDWTRTVGNYVAVTDVQLESITATPFERLPYPQVLALCQRYYQMVTFFHQEPTAGNTFGGTVYHRVSMRAVPTVTLTVGNSNGLQTTPNFAVGGNTNDNSCYGNGVINTAGGYMFGNCIMNSEL